MPETVTPLGRFATATAELKEFLVGLCGSIRELSALELSAYTARRVVAGWRIEVRFDDSIRRFDLLIDDTFPHAPPRVALIDRPPPLTWPHVEDDGVLCLLPGFAEVADDAPVDVTLNVLRAAVELIENCAAGRNQDDFRAEFLSYWNRMINTNAIEFLSLLEARPPSRLVRLWCGQQFYVLGEDEFTVLSWLRNLFLEIKGQPWTTEPALMLWLKQPLHPHEYPQTAAHMRALACHAGGADLLESLAARMPEKIVVLLAAPTPHGPCFAGVTVPAPRAAQLTRGFRPGKIPPKLLAARFLSATSIVRSRVSRVDAPWMHGRDQDLRQPRLHAARVVVLGCGSVGGPVVVRLAQAGVGHLILIDPDTLSWPNVGRHPLGARHVGKAKATALAAQVRIDYPHIGSVVGHACQWQKIAASNPELLSGCDLIVSAIGNWGAEGALNEWHVAHERKPTVIYGWTEPHACAGHAVVIVSEGGCLRCGFTAIGQPTLRVTDWPSGTTFKQEPACGVVFQPYGPVELMHIEATIAELALDALLGVVTESRHRIWVGRRTQLDAAGGTWNTAWTETVGHRPEGGFLLDRSWSRSNVCDACRPGAN